MTVWSWLKLTLSLWLLRKTVKIVGWLLLLAVAVTAWPVTLVTAAGFGAAWATGWPAAWLRRAAAWSLPMTGVWAAAQYASQRHPAALGLGPAADWEHGWHPLTGAGLAREFLQLAPLAIPAGLIAAAGLWAWRNYAITTGLGGWLASAPITFDARQWRRQVRTANAAHVPGAMPTSVAAIRVPAPGP